MSGTRGVVTSPSYPSTNTDNTDCWWQIRSTHILIRKYFTQKYFSVPPGQRVELRWDSFNVGCDGNYVEIVDGLNSGNIRRLIPRLKLRNIFLLKLTNIIV